MYLTWSDPEGSSHTCLCLRVPFLIYMEKNAEYYMRLALKEAQKARDIDEVPVGAVIVKDGKVIARAHNLKEKRMLANAHAEMIAIEKASKKLNNYYLNDCDLYVTLEPCMMCTGNIILSRVRTLYYGTPDPKAGCTETVINIKTIKPFNHHPNVVSGVCQKECAEILTSFFKEKREITKRKKSRRPNE